MFFIPLITPFSTLRGRYRRADRPGEPVRHPGRVGDQIPDMRFGRRNVFDATAKEACNPDVLSAVQDRMQERDEALYLSHKKEPLGTFCVGPCAQYFHS